MTIYLIFLFNLLDYYFSQIKKWIFTRRITIKIKGERSKMKESFDNEWIKKETKDYFLLLFFENQKLINKKSLIQRNPEQ